MFQTMTSICLLAILLCSQAAGQISRITSGSRSAAWSSGYSRSATWQSGKPVQHRFDSYHLSSNETPTIVSKTWTAPAAPSPESGVFQRSMRSFGSASSFLPRSKSLWSFRTPWKPIWNGTELRSLSLPAVFHRLRRDVFDLRSEAFLDVADSQETRQALPIGVRLRLGDELSLDVDALP